MVGSKPDPIIRLATTQDADAILAIYAPMVAETYISFELEVPTRDELASRITSTLEKLPWLVCEQSGSLLGYAYASTHRNRLAYQWSVDVSVYIHPQARRAGVARRLYTSLLAILRAQGYRNVFAGIALPNEASVGVHEAMGFRQAALYKSVGYKLGAWRDVGWWQLTLQPHVPDPQPPRTLPELIASNELPPLAAA